MATGRKARVGFFTRRGRDRAELQDCLLIGPLLVTGETHRPLTVDVDLAANGLIAVFDGMGGHAAGRRAAQLGAAELAELLLGGAGPPPSSRPSLEWAVVETGRRIGDESRRSEQWSGMGTTVAGVYFDRGGARAFNVGDSRAYVLQDRYLCQFSRDHRTSDHTGAALTQCLGGDLREIRPHVVTLPPASAAPVLLCTDGLHGGAAVGELEQALLSPDPIGHLWDLAAGAKDDVGVVLVERRLPARTLTWASDQSLVPPAPDLKEEIDVRPIRRFQQRLPLHRRRVRD